MSNIKYRIVKRTYSNDDFYYCVQIYDLSCSPWEVWRDWSYHDDIVAAKRALNGYKNGKELVKEEVMIDNIE